MNCTYSWKNMDWNWTKNSVQSSVPSGKKIKHSSSAWTITSRRRWSGWILGIKGLSSDLFCDLNIDLMKFGRAKWQETEATRKKFKIVLIRQDKKFFAFKPLKVIQDPVPLILNYRTMCQFRTISSSTFITSDVHSVCTSSQIQDKYWEDKFWANDWRYSSSVDPLNKNTQISEHQNTVYSVNINLALKKGLKFYQTRSNAVILYDTLPAYCIPKAIMMETGQIIYEKVYASPRPPPNIFSKKQLDEKWVQKLLEVVKTPNKPIEKPKIQL